MLERRVARHSLAAIAALGLVLAACSSGGGKAPEWAQDFNAEQYFRGKTVRFTVASSPGGGTDTTARFIAERLSDFIPGKPRVTVTNINNVGAYNSVYNADPDQLAVAFVGLGQETYTSSQEDNAEHDPAKLRFIAGFAAEPRTITVGPDMRGTDVVESVRLGQAGPQIRYAGTAGGPDDLRNEHLQVSWLCSRLALPCEMLQVAADGSSDQAIMMERNEINFTVSQFFGQLKTYGDGMKGGRYNFWTVYEGSVDDLLPEGMAPPPDFDSFLASQRPDLVGEWDKLKPAVTSGGVGKNLWMGPNVPEPVVDSLRQAMVDMMADQALVAEFEKTLKAPQELIPGAETETILRNSYAVFQENTDFYNSLSKTLWDEQWK